MRALLTIALIACGKPSDSGETALPTSAAAAIAEAGPDLAVPVGEAFTLDGSDNVGVAVLWDLGDGTTTADLSPTHTYAAPGHYQAVVQVTGADGAKRSDTATVTAYLPAATPLPAISSTLVLADELLWVAVPEADHVAAIDPNTWTTTVYPVCEHPRTLSVDGGTVAVACEGEDALALLDIATGAVERVALGAGARPYGVAMRGGVAWVSLQGTGQLARWDGALTTVDVGPDPRGIAILPSGEVFATRWRSDPDAATVYATDGSHLSFAYDTTPDSDTTTGGVPNLLDALAVSPDGGALYLPGHHANVRRGAYLSGVDLTHESAVRAVLSTVDLSTGAETSRKQFDERGRAVAVATSPLGDYLYVAHPGTNTISVMDAYNGAQAGALWDVGATPTGLAISSDGTTLYVHAWLEREVRAYDVTDLSAGASLLGSAPTVLTEPLDAEVLLGKQLFYSSADTRLADSGYIACAHCHPDGRDDGQTWDFTDRGEGLRNTTSLEGRAGTGMGRLHWTGNFDEIQDFEADIRNHFGGSGLLTDDDWAATADSLGAPKVGLSSDLDALAAYVASLTDTPRSPSPGAPADAFDAAGCGECHPAPLFTDSALDDPLRHDVGTLTAASGQRLGGPLDGLDTPTLLGAWATGPWLHDGSAPTLRDAIAAHADAPTGAALDEVTAYVEGL